jgi:hypothetical protein
MLNEMSLAGYFPAGALVIVGHDRSSVNHATMARQQEQQDRVAVIHRASLAGQGASI